MKAGVAVLKVAAVLSSLLLGSAFVYYRATDQTPWFLASSSEGATTAPPVKSGGQSKVILTSSKSFAGGTAISGGSLRLGEETATAGRSLQPASARRSVDEYSRSLGPTTQIGHPLLGSADVSDTLSRLQARESRSLVERVMMTSSKSTPIFLFLPEPAELEAATMKIDEFRSSNSELQAALKKPSTEPLTELQRMQFGLPFVPPPQVTLAPPSLGSPEEPDEADEPPERTVIMVSSKSAVAFPPPRMKTPRSPTMQKKLVMPGSKGGTLMITPTSPPAGNDGR